MAAPSNLLPASFRGVPFGVVRNDLDPGLSGQHHKFVGRPRGYWEPLGGEEDSTFTFEAFVVGTDWRDKRDALERALRDTTPGELVHPSRGRKTVVVTGWKSSEDKDEGNVVRFQLTFLEQADGQPAMVTRVDPRAAVVAGADTSLATVRDDFTARFSVSRLAGFATDAAGDVVGDMAAGIEEAGIDLPDGVTSLNALSDAASWLPVAQSVSSSGAGALFRRELASLSGDRLAAMLDPTGLAGRVIGLSRMMSVRAGGGAQAYATHARLWDFGTDLAPVAATTPTRARQAANQVAMADLMRRTAVVESVRASADWSFDSYDQADQVRNTLADRLDAEMETASDPVFVALQDLKAAMAKDIGGRGADLSRVVRWTPPRARPVTVLSYELYDSTDRESDILARNRVRDPALVPGGEPLELLSDG